MSASTMAESRQFDRILQLYLIALSAIYTVTVPLLLITCIPFYCFRLILKLFVETFNIYGLVSMVFARNSVFADDIYGGPNASIVVHVTIDGILDLDTFRGSVMNQMVNQRGPQGEALYAELRQYVVTLCGYSFWKNETNFSIEEHVRRCDDAESEFGTVNLVEIHEQLIRRPFRHNRSPWEFVLVDTVNETHVFFRVHHCLSDGFSILRLLMTEMTGQELRQPQSSLTVQPKRQTRAQNILQKCQAILKVPYDQVSQRYFAKDTNIWHDSSVTLKRRYHAIVSDEIQVDFIRQIKAKRQGDCTFTAIILEGVAGGIRKFFLHNYNMALSKPMHFICPLPITRRPKGLGNYWTFAFVPLPVGDSSRERRLASIMTHLRQAAESSVPTVNYLLIPFVGALPAPLMTALSRNVFSTGIASIFPGPRETCYIHGHRVKDMTFAGGLLHGDQGICVTLISYAGHFRIFLMVDHGILDRREHAVMLMDEITAEINSLMTPSEILMEKICAEPNALRD